MEFTTVLFYAFSVILLFAATRVITDRNPVHAALYLVLSFFSAAAIWLLLKAEFLAIVLVLVYVGAVMVLFLFVVMMLDINLEKLREGFWGYLPFAAIIGLIIVFEMAAVLFHGFQRDAQPPVNAANIGDTKALGMLIYTEYVFAFELAAVLLLVGIISAVTLTLRKRKDTKQFSPSDAIKVKRADRIRMVSMKAESERGDGAETAAAAPADKQ